MTIRTGITTLTMSLIAASALSADTAEVRTVALQPPPFSPPGAHRPGPAVRGYDWGRDRDARSVEELAFELEREVARFHRTSFKRRGRFALPPGSLRSAIANLGEESAHFSAQLAHGHGDPFHTREDFEYLAGAFHDVGVWLSRPTVDWKVRRDFERVDRAFNRLAVHFAPRRVATPRRGARGASYPVVVRGRVGTGPAGTRVSVGVSTRRGHVSIGWNR